jgi:exopolyphosphatase/guanosine-5'-triphosphate,3'-diphosphate pyrophosphatase
MADIDEQLARLELPRGAALVGTAGTATTLATVEQNLRVYQADRVQGYRITRAEVERQLAKFLELTVAEKRHLPGLESQRADVIAGGAAIYARLAARLDASEIVTSDRGVRWGLVEEMAAARR